MSVSNKCSDGKVNEGQDQGESNIMRYTIQPGKGYLIHFVSLEGAVQGKSQTGLQKKMCYKLKLIRQNNAVGWCKPSVKKTCKRPSFSSKLCSFSWMVWWVGAEKSIHPWWKLNGEVTYRNTRAVQRHFNTTRAAFCTSKPISNAFISMLSVRVL